MVGKGRIVNGTALEIAIAAVAVLTHIPAGAGLGLVAGYFGRTIPGLAAAVLLVTVLTSVSQASIKLLAAAVASVPPAQAVSTLTFIAGVAALCGFCGGLYAALRKHS